MPQFINSPYSSNSEGGLASTLSGLGQTMFGDTARRALVTQQMLEKQRQNELVPAAMDALRRQDYGEFNANAYGVNPTAGASANQYALGGRAAGAHGNLDNPEFNVGMTAVHGVAASPTGQRRAEGAAMDRTVQQGANTIAAEQSKPVTIMGPDGALHLVPSNQTEHLINSGGYRLVPTADQSLVMGDMQAAAPAQPAAPPATAQPPGGILPGGEQIMADPAAPGAQAVPGQPAAAPAPITPDTTAQHFSPTSLPPQTKPAPAPAQQGADGSIMATAKMIANGQIPPLNGMAMRTPWGQHVMAAVAQIKPDYRAPDYNMANRAQTQFGSGRQGDVVRSFNVGISHLSTLDKLSDALGNGDVKMVNTIRNAWQNQTGMPAPANFNAAKDVVGAEIIKAVVGAQGALGDRETAQRTLDAANSPVQLKGVIQTYKSLMAGQLHGLRQEYESSTHQKDFDSKLFPETLQELQPAAPQAAGGETWVRGPDGKLVRGQ